jgi:hypothetical protein
MNDMAPSPDGVTAAGTVSVPASAGGCGEQHQAFLNEDGRPTVVCDLCAPLLIRLHPSFAGSPNAVALTCDELAERELAERDGVAMQRVMMRSVTDHFVSELTGKAALPAAPAATARSLVAQLAALTPAERAEIAKLLAGAEPAAPAEPAIRVAVSAPAPAAARRAPGRPRKTAS